jgi:plasmid segregation protein ParM
MLINRFNADYGNSTSNFIADGYFFEMSTSVAELTKEKAESLLTSAVDSTDDLLERLLISTEIDNEVRYFTVAKLAEGDPRAINVNGHMHDKIKSIVPYVTFLAGMAYYYKVQDKEGSKKGSIEIDRKKMMLPIWLLKNEDKFSIAQNKMAERFLGQHNVSLLTPGMELDLTIQVKESKCYIEGEVSRWALKYKITNSDGITKVVKRKEVKQFELNPTVLTDIGGGSTDSALLTKGLNAPISKDSFQVIQIEPYLGRLEVLLKEKLLVHFNNVKSLEKFIVDNYTKPKYILNNPNTGEKTDITAPIVETLREYAEILVMKVTSTFNALTTDELNYVYFGGEAPILAPYISEAVSNRYNAEILERNHFFLADVLEEDNTEVVRPTSRTINLVALEIIALSEQKVAA